MIEIAPDLQHMAVPIESLSPYPGNARRGNLAGVRDSLRKHGQYRAIVCNRRPIFGLDRVVIAGNHTWRAMREEGAADIAVTWVDVDEDEAARINLVDNKLNDDAEYDVSELLKQLEALPDLDGTGYSQTELDELLASITDIPPALTDPDAVPEVPEEPITKRGDLILLGEHRLLCGDSTVLDDVERLLDGRQADMVWTDPPYGVAYQFNESIESLKKRNRRTDGLTVQNDALNEEQLTDFLRQALGNAEIGCKPGASWYAAAPAGPLHNVFGLVLAEMGIWRQSIIWLKDQFVFGRTDYHYRHEPIFYGWKPGAAHYFVDDRTQDSVWEIDRPKRSKEHPTMKPTALIERAINNSSKPGHRVLDLFGGSGSTLIAAQATGRAAYLMELDPRYCDVIVKRWQDYTGQTAIRPE